VLDEPSIDDLRAAIAQTRRAQGSRDAMQLLGRA